MTIKEKYIDMVRKVGDRLLFEVFSQINREYNYSNIESVIKEFHNTGIINLNIPNITTKTVNYFITNTFVEDKEGGFIIIPINYIYKSIYSILLNDFYFLPSKAKSILTKSISYLKKNNKISRKKGIYYIKIENTIHINLIKKVSLYLKLDNNSPLLEKPDKWIYIHTNALAYGYTPTRSSIFKNKQYNWTIETYGKLYSKEYIDIINKLQSIPLMLNVNIDIIDILNKTNWIVKHIQNNKDRILNKTEYKQYKNKMIFNIEGFDQKSGQYTGKYIKKWIDKKKSNGNNFYYVSEYIKYLKKKWKLTYSDEDLLQDKIQSRINQNIGTLVWIYNHYILNNNLNIIFYIPIYLDMRGRYVTLGTINHVNNKLFRLLLNFEQYNNLDNDTYRHTENDLYKFYISYLYKKTKTIDEGIKQFNSTVTYLFKPSKIEHLTPDVAYHLYNYNNNSNCTISLDASSSILQVIGLLMKDKKLLKYTNINPGNDIQDIYLYIINNIDTKIYILCKYRNFIKTVLMKYVYNSNLYSIANSFKDEDIYNYRYIDIDELHQNIKQVIKALICLFPNIKIFRNFINKLASVISANKLNLVYTVYDKRLEYNIYKNKDIVLRNKEHNINISFKSPEIKINKKCKQPIIYKIKVKNSNLVNLIHFIDSYIITETRKILIDNGIPSYGIHDCIGVHPKDYKQAIKAYNISIYKIYKLDLCNDILSEYYSKNHKDIKFPTPPIIDEPELENPFINSMTSLLP